MDVNDEEIFLCTVKSTSDTKNGLAWYKLADIPAKLLASFIETKNQPTTEEPICNTDKTKVNTCEYKSRTCGLQVFCSNCGIILYFKELYGSESCSQLGLMLLDLHENFDGITLL